MPKLPRRLVVYVSRGTKRPRAQRLTDAVSTSSHELSER